MTTQPQSMLVLLNDETRRKCKHSLTWLSHHGDVTPGQWFWKTRKQTNKKWWKFPIDGCEMSGVGWVAAEAAAAGGSEWGECSVWMKPAALIRADNRIAPSNCITLRVKWNYWDKYIMLCSLTQLVQVRSAGRGQERSACVRAWMCACVSMFQCARACR